MDENKGHIVISKNKLKFAVLVVIALVVGFILGGFFPLFGSASDSGSEPAPEFSLSMDDKEFLVELANSQVDLTAAKTAAVSDWCTSNGGVWNESYQRGELEVSEDIVPALEGQGVTVTERDGKFYASVVLVTRNGCIFVSK